MAIIGTPIANGDGSYTFQQDDGEPLVLRGDSAMRVANSMQGAPPPVVPPLPANQAMEDAYAQKPMGNALALGGDEPPPFDPSVIAGMNRQDRQKSATDAQGRAEQVINPAGYAATHSHGGSADESHLNMVRQAFDKPLPQAAAQEPAQRGGAVFYKPQQAPQPQRATGGGGAAAGKPVPVQQTVQGTMPASEEDKALVKRSMQDRYLAGEQVTEAEVARQKEVAAFRANQIKENQDAEVGMQGRELERQRVIGQKLAKVDQLAQEAAAGKIDPDHYWVDKSAETKFGLAILQGVSAWAEAMGGGKAYAVQMVNQAIDRDMHAQELNLQNKRADLAAQTNLLGQLRQEFGDRDAAAAAFRAAKLATAGATLEEINARNLPAEQKAKLAEFAAGLNADYTNQMQVAGKIAYSRTDRFGGVGGGAGLTPYVNNDGSFLDLEDGTAIKASSPEMASQWREQIGGIAETEDAVRELRAELKKGPSVQNANKVKILVNNIATSAGAAKLGTAKQSGMGELKNIEEYLGQNGNVTSDVLGRTAGALDAVEASVKHVKRRIFGAAPRYSDAQPNGKGGLIRQQIGRGIQPQGGGQVQIQPAEEP